MYPESGVYLTWDTYIWGVPTWGVYLNLGCKSRMPFNLHRYCQRYPSYSRAVTVAGSSRQHSKQGIALHVAGHQHAAHLLGTAGAAEVRCSHSCGAEPQEEEARAAGCSGLHPRRPHKLCQQAHQRKPEHIPASGVLHNFTDAIQAASLIEHLSHFYNVPSYLSCVQSRHRL